MAKRNLNTRVDESMVSRATALIDPVKKDDDLRLQAVGTVNLSVVVRLALLMGIEQLEKKYGIGRSGKARKR